ncbi:MAG: heparinase II/III-family protein [Lachnospiraceae bacterium]|nr:heparinase II/III-family protein [Lachnospiraceae bacterium]
MNNSNLKNFIDEYEKELLGLAEEYRDMGMPVLTEELFPLFEKTGDRLRYEKIYFMRRKMLSVYAVLAEKYKRKDDYEKLGGILLSICDEETWALPAHVKKGEDKRFVLDLFASETAESLLNICEKCGEGLDADIKERAKKEVIKRVIEPFKNGRFEFEVLENNWNSVCLSNIGCAAVMLGEWKVVERCFKGIDHYLKGFGDDGVCPEGLHYWTYGLFYYFLFMDRLEKLKEPYEQENIHDEEKVCTESLAVIDKCRAGAKRILSCEKIKKIAAFGGKCILPGGYSVSFADSHMREKLLPGLIFYISEKFELPLSVEKESLWSVEETDCYRYEMIRWSLFGGEELLNKRDIKGNESLSNFELFEDAGWAIYNANNGSAFAVKGGNNDESHNHNDVGSYILVLNGELICADLGRGEYCADYFGEKRYDFLCTSSLGHSVPAINGKGQNTGALCRADEFTADNKGRVEIEFSSCYGECLNKLKRTCEYDIKSGELEITDLFDFYKNEENKGSDNSCGGDANKTFENDSEIVISDNIITLLPVKINGNTALIGDNALLTAKGEYLKLEVNTKSYRNGDGEEVSVNVISVIMNITRQNLSCESQNILRYRVSCMHADIS